MCTGIFLSLTSAETCEKGSWLLWKGSCVSTGIRKDRKHMYVTDCHDMTLAVKVELNPNTTNAPITCNDLHIINEHFLFYYFVI